MQPGQFLIHEGGSKAKILGICGEVIFLSLEDKFDKASSEIYTEEDLKECGWSLLEEPWKPTNEDKIFMVTMWGKYQNEIWGDLTEGEKQHLLTTNNYARTEADAELY